MKTVGNPDKETRDQWHDDSSNWRLGIFYFNKKDKRIFPPKRIPDFGWTVNFANPFSYLTFIAVIAIILIVSYYLKTHGALT